MNRKIALLGLAFTLVFTAAAAAQDPNFSGRWKMTSAKVEPEMENVIFPEIALEIKHEGIHLTIITTVINSEINSPPTERRYTTDRKECLNPSKGSGDLKSVAYLENGILIIEGEAEATMVKSSEGAEPEISYVRIQSHEEFSLSADQKTLTVVRKTDSSIGPTTRTTTLTKIS